MNYLIAFQKSITFHKIFARISRSATHAVFLSQCVDWTLESTEDGWFSRSQSQWREETFLTRREIENAEKFWASLGVLEVAKRGMPRTTHYTINADRLKSVIEGFLAEAGEMEIDRIRAANSSLPEVTIQFARNSKLDGPSLPEVTNKSARSDKLFNFSTRSSNKETCDKSLVNNDDKVNTCADGTQTVVAEAVAKNEEKKSKNFKKEGLTNVGLPPYNPPSTRKNYNNNNIFTGNKDRIGGTGERKGKGGVDALFPEVEQKTETQTLLDQLLLIDGFSAIWDEYMAYRKKMRWPCTERALLGILRPLAKYPDIATDYLQHTLTCGYRGVREDWIKKFASTQKVSLDDLKKKFAHKFTRATFDV